MTDGTGAITVRRASPQVAVIAIAGEVTAARERELLAAFATAGTGETRVIALDFRGLAYMNSGGIGLLVTLLVRANLQGQKLTAFGLDEHYREMFNVTRLDEAISLADTEAGALAEPVAEAGE